MDFENLAIETKTELLPLDLAERTVVLRTRETGALRRHIFRRIERADVDAYYSALVVASERRGQTVEDEIDLGTAELKLYDRAIVRVEGYKLTDGRDLAELGNWKDRVPGGHRIRAVDLLMKVSKSQSVGDQLLDPDCDVVALDACWTERDGAMLWHRGLIHRFTPPTLVHWKKVNSRRTRSIAIGGSRSQRTIYPNLDGMLGDLYDELIVSAEGYGFAGAPIADRSALVVHMDRFHKIAAASQLFDRGSSDEALADEAEA